jgi:hypothetical protein
MGLLVGTALPAQQPAPLSKGDVLELIAAGVPSARLAALVEERGISFEMTPEAAEELRKAGASGELLGALKFASKLRNERATQPPATLNIEAEPGSADIYLDDELKGTTSHEGKLRLTGLAPGTYRLRVSATGFQTWEKEIVAKPGEVQTVTVVLPPESAEKPGATKPAEAKAVPAAPEAAKPKVLYARPVEEIVAAAKSLCIVLEGQTLPVIKSELSKKLHEWGKLALVASPDKADLILKLTQTGRLGQGIEGHQAVASLVERESDVELWSSTQGGSWTWSGWNPAWVGRALAEEFIKFYDTSMNARKRQN